MRQATLIKMILVIARKWYFCLAIILALTTRASSQQNLSSNQTIERYSNENKAEFVVQFEYDRQFFGGKVPVTTKIFDKGTGRELSVETTKSFDPASGRIWAREVDHERGDAWTEYLWDPRWETPLAAACIGDNGDLWVATFNFTNREGTEAVVTWLKNHAATEPTLAKEKFRPMYQIFGPRLARSGRG